MATHTYSHNYPTSDEQLKYYNWGVQYPPEPTTERTPHYRQLQDQTDYYSNSRHGEEIPATHTDYSQVSAVDTGFKKLKSNQMEILKQLRRQYEVLRSTELDSDIFPNKKFRADSRQSINDSGYHSRSSSKSGINYSRRKSQQKEWQIVSLQKKQLEVMLNNSMRKIEQLLNQEIQLKKTILQLKTKLENIHMNQSEYQIANKRQRDENESLRRTLQETRKQCQSLKGKIKELTNNINEIQSQYSISQLNLKKKDERIRAMEEEVYLQKNKFCNLQLDLKKANLQIQLIERSYKEQINVIQRRLSNTDDHLMIQKNEEIKRLTHQNLLKDQRYKMLLNIASKGNEDNQSKQYIKKLQELVNSLKEQKNQKSSHSQQVLSQTIKKIIQLQQKQVKPDLQLSVEVASLRRQLEELRSQPPQKDQNTPSTQLLSRILQLQKFIQQENTEKLYFVQDLKKMQSQLIEEKKIKDDALKQIKELKELLRKAEDQSRKYSYELDTIKNLHIDLTQSQHQQNIVMIKAQQLGHIRDSEILHLRQQNLKLTEKNKAQLQEYEEELKTIKRQLNQKQCQIYRTKEELQLKLSLARTQFQAELHRLQQDLQRTKKAHASELNQRVNEKVQIQGKLLEKIKQNEKLSNQLNTIVKQRDTAFQNYRNEYEQKLKGIQQRHTTEMSKLLERIQSLASISDKHQQLISRNGVMEQEIVELKRLLRANRQINEGVDHLWRVKEAQYSNLNNIIKQLQDF